MIEIGDLSEEESMEEDDTSMDDLSLSMGEEDEELLLEPAEEDDESFIEPKEDEFSDEADTSFEPETDISFEAAIEDDEAVAQEPIIARNMLLNLPHQLTVEIGKASLKGEDITHLTYGSIIELDKKIGEPVDIILGAKMIAKGEVVQINDEQLGVRITRIDY